MSRPPSQQQFEGARGIRSNPAPERRTPMGYTHYWGRSRDFTREEWAQIREDF
jgi:hypothetical protein